LRIDEIIGVLPGLIFLSLFVFSVGLFDWLYHVHRGVAAAIIIIGAVFCIFAVSQSVQDVASPFKTQFSRSLPGTLQRNKPYD
jgi:uncharacterized membrane protein YqjE